MRIVKFLISLVITALLIYALDNRWVIGHTPIPPIAKFLDPLGGFWRNLESSNHKAPEPMTMQGVQDQITVIVDSLAIPHIFANNDLDLYFAQGYVTARHRLWQMEFLTHAAAGRVSELVGAGPNNSIIDYDRGQRRLGMIFAAQRGLDALARDQAAMIMIEKYTEGINAYISSLTYKNLPFEYKLLNYRPEPWTTLKCLLLMKSMAQSLSMGERDMEMTNALKLFGPEMVDLLYPDKEGVGDPIVENTGGWKAHRIISDSVPLALPDALINVSKLPGPDLTNGSNNWAVSGSKTATGSPILSGDPHLDLSLPSLWYVVQLNAPGINALGSSLPGLPGIIIGSTDSIAWSETNAQRDAVDWFEIKFQNSRREKYLVDSQWVDTEKRIEKFAVRDGATLYDTVVYTSWGPIPYDANYRNGDNRRNFAFRWMAHEPTEDIVAIYKINRAKDYASYMEAISHVGCPAQNLVFASVNGEIAMNVQGKFPLRRSLEGKFVLDGSKGTSGWLATIPSADNISSRNASRGFESSANQYPVDYSYPHYIHASNWEAYRNRRINKVLTSAGKITIDDMMKLQTDNYNTKAEDFLPYMLSQVDSVHLAADEREAYRTLSRWNYLDDPDAEGATYFQVWFRNIKALTWDEMDNPNALLANPSDFMTVRLIRENPTLSFFDIQATPEKETAPDIIRKAFSFSVADVKEWRKSHNNATPMWADFKQSFIRHLLRIEPLGEPVRGGGSAEAINALSRSHGPSWRMIVSLERAGVKMWGVYPGGQSGNPGSPFYNNMTEHWLDGKYYPIKFYKNVEEAANGSFYKLQINKP